MAATLLSAPYCGISQETAYDSTSTFSTDIPMEAYIGQEIVVRPYVSSLSETDREGYPDFFIDLEIANGKVVKGMTREMVLEAWGEPDSKAENSAAGIHVESWSYPRGSLTLLNGKVDMVVTI